MRNSKMKYGGIIVAIIGAMMLAILGFAYAWDEARDFSAVDMGEYSIYAIIGAIIVTGGLLTYLIVDE